MADIDLKTLTPGTAAASSVIVGATSTGAASPSLFTTTGSGNVALATSPTFVTPTLGVASATSINKVTLTASATGSTLTIADGKTLTASNSLTLAGTDGSTLDVGTGGTLGALATVSVGAGVATAAANAVNGSGGFITYATFAPASGKALTLNNTLTLAGTDSTTMTFPSTSTTLAGLGIANTFTANQTISGAGLIVSGNISAATWGTNGLRYKSVPGTLTDTSAAGTVAAAYTNVYGGNTIAASNARTFTDYFTTYISEPTAGTNVTFTNKWAFGLTGNMRVTGSATVTGNVTAPNTNAATAALAASLGAF